MYEIKKIKYLIVGVYSNIFNVRKKKKHVFLSNLINVSKGLRDTNAQFNFAREL